MSEGYNLRKWVAAQRGDSEATKILEWQSQLRDNDQQGLFHVTFAKYNITFKFDPRWDELLKAKHQTRDSYGLFGDHAALFHDLNRSLIHQLGGEFVKKDNGIHLKKETTHLVFDAVNAFLDTRDEVLKGTAKVQGNLPNGILIDDKEKPTIKT